MPGVICVDNRQRETTEHGRIQFPLEINHDNLSTFKDGLIRCHWHEELEFSIVAEGSASYTLGNGVRVLHAGEGILINSRVPHMITPYEGKKTRLLTVIVAPGFIYGNAGSVIENLLLPFLYTGDLASAALSESEINALICIDELNEKQPFAWELKCKELLCGIFFQLLTKYQKTLCSGVVYGTADLQRLNLILEHLHQQYMAPLRLAEISDCVHMTRESCCRFFKRMTGQTISQYLQDYRIAQSMKLLQEGQQSITQIALAVGFSNAGRFSAAFSRRMGCTPKQFHDDKCHPQTMTKCR